MSEGGAAGREERYLLVSSINQSLWEPSAITYNNIWHPRAKRQSTQMNYWKYEPSPAEVPAWECINLSRQQTADRYSEIQSGPVIVCGIFAFVWAGVHPVFQYRIYFVQFSSALTDCQSDKAEDVRAAGGHYKLYCSQSTEMIFRSQTRAQRGSSSVITTRLSRADCFDNRDWLLQYIGSYMKLATICTVTNLNFPPLTSLQY